MRVKGGYREWMGVVVVDRGGGGGRGWGVGGMER